MIDMFLPQKEIKIHLSVRLAITVRAGKNKKTYCTCSQTARTGVCPYSHNEGLEMKANYSYNLDTITSEVFLESQSVALGKLSHILIWRIMSYATVSYQCF